MRRFTMLASLLMVLCLQMAAQTWEEVKVGTSTRKTLTYVPKNVEKSPALVISLHGMNQDPEYQQKQTQWNAMADTEGFIVTYPLGNNRMWDTSGMGDVKFVEAIMKDMELKHNVDKNRIYLSGFSMGSWLGYHCAWKLLAIRLPLSDRLVVWISASSLRQTARCLLCTSMVRVTTCLNIRATLLTWLAAILVSKNM